MPMHIGAPACICSCANSRLVMTASCTEITCDPPMLHVRRWTSRFLASPCMQPLLHVICISICCPNTNEVGMRTLMRFCITSVQVPRACCTGERSRRPYTKAAVATMTLAGFAVPIAGNVPTRTLFGLSDTLSWFVHLLGHWACCMTEVNPIFDGMPVIGHACQEDHRIAHDLIGQRADEFM